MLKYNKD